MGCCETRDQKRNLDISESSTDLTQSYSLRLQAESINIKKLEEIKDPKVLEIAEYVQKLEQEDKWVMFLSDYEFTAKKLSCSKFNKDNIITRVSIRLGSPVILQHILDYIVDVDFRKTWDDFSIYLVMVEGENYSGIIHRKIKAMFYSADFIEKQTVLLIEDKVFVVTYSIDRSDLPNSPGFVRADNIMTVFVITENDLGTEITLINQVEPNNVSVRNFAGNIGLYQQKNLVKNLKSRILSVKTS